MFQALHMLYKCMIPSNIIILLWQFQQKYNCQFMKPNPEIPQSSFTKANPKLKIGRKAVDRLGLKYEKDEKGKPVNNGDINWLSSILGQMLRYPSARLAQKHRRAKKLGNLDRKIDQKQIQAGQEKSKNLQEKPEQQIRKQKISENKPCKCCGLPIQKRQLSLWTSHGEVLNLGLSNLLYFETMKNLIFLIVFIFFILGIFLIPTNVMSSIMYKSTLEGQEQIDLFKTYEGVLSASIGSKQYLRNTFAKITMIIQSFLTVLCILVLWFRIYKVIVQNKQIENQIDSQIISASDFTLMFSNVPKRWCPTDHYQLMNQLEGILNKYVKQVKKIMGEKQFKDSFGNLAAYPIKIAQTTVCLNMDLSWIKDADTDFGDKQLQQINGNLQKTEKELFNIVIKRSKDTKFEITQQRLKQLYKNIYELRERKQEKFQQNVQKIFRQISTREKDLHIVFFISFDKTENKQLLQKLYSKRYSFIHNLPCFSKNRTYLRLPDQEEKQQLIHVEPAPEPEDIYWDNFKMSRMRRNTMRAITFVVTLLILFFSFAIIFYLTAVQLTITDSTGVSSSSSFFSLYNLISIAISIFLPVLNTVISEMIRVLTMMEKNISYTQQQTSIAVKSIVALVLNSIVIPLTVNYLLKQNLYGVGGLADEVFSQAISLAIVTPILKVINPSYLIYRAKLWWYNRPWNKLYLKQRQLNKLFQQLKFEVGSEYVEIIMMYLYCCFYATLQPLVIPIILVGLFLLLIAQRANLYKYSCRPVPGNSQINDAMTHIICAGPLFLALGDFLWTYYFSTVSHGLILNLITLILGVIILLFPFNYFANKSLKKILEIRNSSYDKDRIFFPSQYERLNPITSKQGHQSYKKYVRQYLNDLVNNKKSVDEIKQIERRLQKINMYGPGQSPVFQYEQQIGHEEPYVQVFINGQNLETIKKQYKDFLLKQKSIIEKYRHLMFQYHKMNEDSQSSVCYNTYQQYIKSGQMQELDFRIFIGDYNNNEVIIEEVDFDLLEPIDDNVYDLDESEEEEEEEIDDDFSYNSSEDEEEDEDKDQDPVIDILKNQKNDSCQ